MVLPASAAGAAPPAGAWLDRLSRILRLSDSSVIVLLDRARPERLGDVVRHLLRERPDVEVVIEAPALASLPEGSTAILCVRAADAGWLNQERPVVQARGLRVVLFSDEKTTVHLSRTAVDFYDWISHRIDCPAGPPAFAVRALRRAAYTRAAAVAWGGGDLEGSFARALPGRGLSRVSAAQPYAALVEALAPRGRAWIAVEGIDGATRWRRTLWAAAEAGRRGRLVLVEPVGEGAWPGLMRAHARPLAVEEGAAKLRAVGIGRAARLAAVLELSPEAIEDAVKLAGAGVAGRDLEVTALEEEAGTALVRLAKERDRAGMCAVEDRIEDADTLGESRRRFSLGDWPARVEIALEAGDAEVASHWAGAWRVSSGRDVRSTAALARVRLLIGGAGAVGEARSLLDATRRGAAVNADEDTRFEWLRAEGLVLPREGYADKAIQPLQEAIKLARQLGRTLTELSELEAELIGVLLSAERRDEAERAFEAWDATLRVQDSTQLFPLMELVSAKLMLARGDTSGASQMLENVLQRWTHPEHPNREHIEQLLAEAWLAQGRFHEAERLMRAAIERVERLGRDATQLRDVHGRALFQLGHLREAEKELRRVLERIPNPERAAGARGELARSLMAQGRLDEAASLIDVSLAALRRDGIEHMTTRGMFLLDKARIHRLRGDLVVASGLFRDVLGLAERDLGREHPMLIPILVELGGTLIDCGEAPEAEPVLRRAVRLAEQAGDRLRLAAALGELARAQAAQGFLHARDTAHRALGINAEGELSPALRRELESIVAGAAAPPLGRSRRRG